MTHGITVVVADLANQGLFRDYAGRFAPIARRFPDMAVYKSKDKFRTKPWCSDNYIGSTKIRAYFATKKKADDDDTKKNSNPDQFINNKRLEGFTVGTIVQEYLDEEAPKHNGYKFEKSRIS